MRRDAGVVLLLTPPFDAHAQDPGYIKGYPPGVRENGGQYTHAAVWMVMALARLGSGDEAAELFHLLNPSITRARRADVDALPGRALRGRRPTSTRTPRTSGAAAGPGTPARPAGCTAPGSKRSSALERRGCILSIDPCIPAFWPGFAISWRFGTARYEIKVKNPEHRCTGVAEVELDGKAVDPSAIPLRDDGRKHSVRAVIGTPVAAERSLR